MKRDDFLRRHNEGPMIRMPNAWDKGTAKIMEDAGAEALGTTSAGILYAQGLPDYEGALTRDECLRYAEDICNAVDIPISIDSEDGYGDTPEQVADSFKMMIEVGAMGGSIEDHPRVAGRDLLTAEETADRVRAARETIDASGVPFVLTARAECYLVGHPDRLNESIRRIQMYEAAGAHCVYVPGLRKSEEIQAVLDAVTCPVNILVGIKTFDLLLSDLEAMGVRRISTGGSIACAAFGLIRAATQGVLNDDLGYRDGMITHDEFTRLFGEGPAAGI
jgi:2-methylisocitrate lyase-like PEP mutase family enzyme